MRSRECDGAAGVAGPRPQAHCCILQESTCDHGVIVKGNADEQLLSNNMTIVT